MHVAALENAEAAGQRYLCTSRYLHFTEIAEILRKAYPQAPVPSKSVPSWLMRLLVYWQPTIRQVINDVGNEKHFDGSKGRALLGRDYRTAEQTILDSASGVIALGLFESEATVAEGMRSHIAKTSRSANRLRAGRRLACFGTVFFGTPLSRRIRDYLAPNAI